jgi:rod shape-determining protein MreD
MRWLAFAILAYLVIAIQMALAGFIKYGIASPNLVLPIAVFIAINARREDALIAVFILGFLQDLFTVQPPGLYAFSYGLVGLFVVGARPAVYRDHPLTHLFVTLVGGLVTAAVVLLNEWAYPILHHAIDAPKPSVSLALAAAVYSALLAPILLAPLARIKWIFGFRTIRAIAPGARHLRAAGRS